MRPFNMHRQARSLALVLRIESNATQDDPTFNRQSEVFPGRPVIFHCFLDHKGRGSDATVFDLQRVT